MIKLIAWDWRMLARDRLALWLLLTLIVAIVLAAGGAILSARDNGAAYRAQLVSVDAARATLLEAVAKGDEKGSAPARARLNMLLPPAPAGDIIAGRDSFDPKRVETGPAGQANRLFQNYQVENPWTLMQGRFDFGFLLVTIVPLLIIGLGYSTISQDRAQGTLRLIETGGGSSGRVLVARLVARGLLIGIPILAALVLVGCVNAPDIAHGERVSRLFALAAIAIAGMAFWWMVVAFVNRIAATAEQAAGYLLSAWIAFALIIPAAVSSLVQAVIPPPSSIDLVVAGRKASVEAAQRIEELMGVYISDHPELQKNTSPIKSYMKDLFFVSREVDHAVTPVVAQFEEAFGRQQRLSSYLQFLSPSLLFENALVAVAGTDTHRRNAFHQQAVDRFLAFREHAGRSLIGDELLTREQAEKWTEFSFREPSPSLALSLVGLFAWVAIAVLAIARHGNRIASGTA